MTGDRPTQYLSADEVSVLKFVGRRQLTRWANKHELEPRQHAQRVALLRAMRILDDQAFTDGCDLHVPAPREDLDA